MTPDERRDADLLYEKIKSERGSRASLVEAETFDQAQTFETIKNKYLGDGLCFRCAAQAAYGHQHGFTMVHPPCAKCLPVVARFPVPVSNTKWHRWPRGGRRPKGTGTPSPLPADPVRTGSRYSETTQVGGGQR